ncbi:MAG: hypothetical protein ABI120_06780 [Gemmatimonadaceae bacterium]
MRYVPAVVALLLVVACTKTEHIATPVAPMVVRTDSAGIEIVQITQLDSTALERWTVGPEPITVVGDDERGDAHVFTFVKGQVRMPDGRLLIALGDEIREFDSTGTFIRNIARKGRGPGEFNDLSAMQRIHGDTLVAYERYPATATLFSPSGQYIRRSSVIRPRADEEVPGTSFKAIFPDGTLLLAQRPPGEHLSKLGVVWSDSARPLRVDITGKVIASFPKHWDHDATRVEARAGTVPVGQERFLGSMPAQPRRSDWGVVATQMYYVNLERFEIALWSGEGKLRRIVRMTTRDIPRTPADSEIFHFKGATYDNATVSPKMMPPVRSVESDRDGNFWITLDQRALDGGAPAVLVVDSTGNPIARSSWSLNARSASKFRLLRNNRDISAQAVTSLAIDADERIHVLVFPLRKTAAPRSAKLGAP